MNIGMLWYDDSPTALKERVERAAAYYQEKYGRKPNLCLVHPSMLNGDEPRVNGIQVRRFASVRPGHFWIGVDDEPEERARGSRAGRSRTSAGRAARAVGKAPGKPAAAKPARSAKAVPGRGPGRTAARQPRPPARKKAAGRRSGRR
jgi:hypothetical protein